ncbi:type I methionyl aminopeptidase [Candidatus Gracilibacteria bacterium]|nr:type I methionyl aminopeptidase [Candidatus Gracilibacteria bacterium]MCF7819122.1 type I methionyl aminopeptidase [Candidatus Gracilibacteria bacterium]
MSVRIKSSKEIASMREGAAILRKVQESLRAKIAPGVTLKQLDTLAENIIRSAKAEPSFKGYQGFPATLCTMINSEVVHGIPDDRALKKGDLLSVDCGVKYKNLHTDAAFSVIVGGDEQNPTRARFSQCVREALLSGCKKAVAGNRIGDIGNAIEKVIRRGGYRVCREYTGHGFGYDLHEEPHVYNYGKPGTGELLEEGMTLAIEPIIASGNPETKTLSDNWTVVTVDGRDACQWEHCGVVTKSGFEIFV